MAAGAEALQVEGETLDFVANFDSCAKAFRQDVQMVLVNRVEVKKKKKKETDLAVQPLESGDALGHGLLAL